MPTAKPLGEHLPPNLSRAGNISRGSSGRANGCRTALTSHADIKRVLSYVAHGMPTAGNFVRFRRSSPLSPRAGSSRMAKAEDATPLRSPAKPSGLESGADADRSGTQKRGRLRRHNDRGGFHWNFRRCRYTLRHQTATANRQLHTAQSGQD